MLITGYIDESANTKIFTLSCLLATPMDWRWIESKWKAVLRKKNKELRKEGRPQISRYHATDCANLKREFRGWSIEEQINLTKQMILILKSCDVSVMAYTMPLDDFALVYKCDKPALHMHGYLLKCLMHQLIYDIDKHAQGHPLKPYSIALIHDRCDRDADMLGAFNEALQDESFEGRNRFISITPLGWENCIPLQAADLLAYETFRDVVGKIAGVTRRKSLASLLYGGKFGGHSKTLNRKALELIRRRAAEVRAKSEADGFSGDAFG